MKNSFPNSSKWKFVLLDIYRHSPNTCFENHKTRFWSDNNYISKRLSLKGADVGMAVEFLIKNNLLGQTNPLTPLNSEKINPGWTNGLTITEKGFNVALEIEKQFREFREKRRLEVIQWTMVILTGVLAISTILNIFY